jgi:hypothetical protein
MTAAIAVAAYPWDLLDDPAAADAVAALGAERVSLAALYHSTRAFSPRNPRRRFVDAHHAARYWRPAPGVLEGLRLRPEPPAWADEDAFGAAAARLRARGVAVAAWVVVTHSSLLGRRHPELTLVDAWGDHLAHALCPAQPDVRAYAAALVGDLAGREDVDALELEACGYLGFPHGSHHEKCLVALDEVQAFLLSICFCPACAALYAGEGLEPEAVAAAVRGVLDGELAGTRAARGPLADRLGDEVAAGVLAARRRAVTELHGAIAATLPARELPVVVTLGPDELAAGAAIGAASPAGTLATAAMAPTYGLAEPAARDVVARTRERATGHLAAGIAGGVPDAAEPGALARRVADARTAGADGVLLYHLGLLDARQLAAVAAALEPAA